MKLLVKILFFIIFSFIFEELSCQITDDFDDGDFTQNPTWMGDTDKYIVNSNKQLQLNASEAGTANLAVKYDVFDTLEWRFYLKNAFAGSANNFVEIFLCADDADLARAGNGYILRFGEAGSNDAVELQRLQAGTREVVCRGKDGLISSSFALWFKVIRTPEGHWTIASDDTGAGDYSTDSEGYDNILPPYPVFGISATVTAGNIKKVYFDDVYIGPIQIDKQPPQPISLVVVDSNNLELMFDEAVTASSAYNTHNFICDNGVGNPSETHLSDDKTTIFMSFAKEFPNGQQMNLIISNITDIAGNVLSETKMNFLYFRPQEFDLIISEIMADPEPSVGLPAFEYLEIQNMTDFDVNLKGWAVIIGSSVKVITDDCTIKAMDFLVFCSENAAPELSALSDSVSVSVLPSFNLPNNGSKIQLCDYLGMVIHSVEYSIAWYGDANKSDGGYSLEIIDPWNPCIGAAGWTASNALSGGTPGAKNSVDGIINVVPKIENVEFINSSDLLVRFNQTMETNSLISSGRISLDDGIVPIEAAADAAYASEIILYFDFAFQKNERHRLGIGGGLTCNGTEITDSLYFVFGLPDKTEQGDILINEILFDPIAPGVDYVELYNNSSKILNINELKLGNISHTFPNPPDTTYKDVSSKSYLLMPDEYVLLCSDTAIVAEQYGVSNERFVQMPSFPTFPISNGHPVVALKTGVVVDEMAYSEKMHYPLLSVTRGVSLERVEGSDVRSWHSAAADCGYGTPGYKNSMSVIIDDEAKIGVVPEIFSPDNDGRDDITAINIELNDYGYSVSVDIFSDDGNRIRRLLAPELSSGHNVLSWDGTDDGGSKVRPGIYILLIETFTVDGKSQRYKRAVVVAD